LQSSCIYLNIRWCCKFGTLSKIPVAFGWLEFVIIIIIIIIIITILITIIIIIIIIIIIMHPKMLLIIDSEQLAANVETGRHCLFVSIIITGVLVVFKF
jgi:hypothetical protein